MTTLVTVEACSKTEKSEKIKKTEDIFRFAVILQAITGQRCPSLDPPSRLFLFHKFYGILVISLTTIFCVYIGYLLKNNTIKLMRHVLYLTEYIVLSVNNVFKNPSSATYMFDKMIEICEEIKAKDTVKAHVWKKYSVITASVILLLQNLLFCCYLNRVIPSHLWFLTPFVYFLFFTFTADYLWRGAFFLKIQLLMQTFKHNVDAVKLDNKKCLNNILKLNRLNASYKKLASFMEYFGANINCLYGSCITMTVPRLLLFLFAIFYSETLENVMVSGFGFLFIHETLANVVLLSPAFFAHQAVLQYEAVIKRLSILLRSTKDPDERNEIKELQRTMKTRPIQFSILRMIPIDLSLPVNYVNVLLTHSLIAYNFINLLRAPTSIDEPLT